MPTFIRTGSHLAHVGFLIPDDPEACWEWQGSHDPSGYAQGYSHHLGRVEKAHRVVWALLNGPPPLRPSGYELDHTCKNRGCVNPSHLELVTVATNRARRNFDHLKRPPTHGTPSGYVNHKCRCVSCRTAWTAYLRNRRYQAKCLQALKDTLNRKPLGA